VVSTKRGSYAVGRERRERILDVATERFATEGYSQTSLADIARAVGLTTPGLKHYFPTKQHLLLAIADHRFDIAADLAASAQLDDDGLGLFRQMLHITEWFASQPALTELFVFISAEAADPNSPAHALFAQRYEHAVASLADALRAGSEQGRLRADIDHESIARECIAVADGIQLQWVITRGALDMTALIRGHIERLLPAITVSGEPVAL